MKISLLFAFLLSFAAVTSHAQFNFHKKMSVKACNIPWGGQVAHAGSITAWRDATGQLCTGGNVSEVRTCNNGVLSGSYTYQNANNQNCSCNLPWGGQISHGASVTAYAYSVGLNCDGGNVSQTRTCSNGSLSGSYSYQSANNRNCNCYAAKAGGYYTEGVWPWSGGSCPGSCNGSCSNGTWIFYDTANGIMHYGPNAGSK